MEVGLHLVLIPGVGVHDVPAAGLVVGADDEGLLVVVPVVVGLGTLVEGLLGIGLGDLRVDRVGHGRRLGGRDVVRDRSLGTVGARVVA